MDNPPKIRAGYRKDSYWSFFWPFWLFLDVVLFIFSVDNFIGMSIAFLCFIILCYFYFFYINYPLEVSFSEKFFTLHDTSKKIDVEIPFREIQGIYLRPKYDYHSSSNIFPQFAQYNLRIITTSKEYHLEMKLESVEEINTALKRYNLPEIVNLSLHQKQNKIMSSIDTTVRKMFLAFTIFIILLMVFIHYALK